MAEALEGDKSKTKTSRNFCFTDFELLEWGQFQLTYKDVVRYVAVGREICPKTKMPHYQGWLQFVSPKTWRNAKAWVATMSNKVHLEVCRGSVEANEEYCRKDGAFASWGAFKVQGQRTEWESVKKTLDEGGTMWDVAQDHFREFMKYPKALVLYKAMRDARLDRPWRQCEVTLIHGPTGTGKTRMAIREAKASDGGWYMMHGAGMRWWDGYTGQRNLVIDEYANQVKITTLLGLLDGHPKRLEVKGTFAHANWLKVWITTNLEWDDIHPKADWRHRDALDRRITRRVNMDRPLLQRQDVVMDQE